jgi:hypothetical protein
LTVDESDGWEILTTPMLVETDAMPESPLNSMSTELPTASVDDANATDAGKR